MKRLILLLSVFGVFLFASCGSGKTSEEQAAEAPEVDMTDELNEMGMGEEESTPETRIDTQYVEDPETGEEVMEVIETEATESKDE